MDRLGRPGYLGKTSAGLEKEFPKATWDNILGAGYGVPLGGESCDESDSKKLLATGVIKTT